MLLVTVEFELMEGVENEFDDALQRMRERVMTFEGFLGEKACERIDGNGYLTATCWRDRESLAAWRDDPAHREVQELGRRKLLKSYRIVVAEIERDYDWRRDG